MVAWVVRRADRVEALAVALGSALVVAADLTDCEQAMGAVGQVVSFHGRLDIVVNAAGVMLNVPILDARLHEWERMLETRGQRVADAPDDSGLVVDRAARAAADGDRVPVDRDAPG